MYDTAEYCVVDSLSCVRLEQKVSLFDNYKHSTKNHLFKELWPTFFSHISFVKYDHGKAQQITPIHYLQ